MSDLVIAEYEEIANVADAIRSKAGITGTMTLSEMATNVSNIIGEGVMLDTALSETSNNPVQNKVITAEIKQLKANAIKRTYSGETIVARDSSGVHLEGLRVLGRGEQVSTTGAQLFDASKLSTTTAGGATVTNNGDGSFTIGGKTLTETLNSYYDYTHDETLELLKTGDLHLQTNIETYPFVYMMIKYSNGSYGQVDNNGRTHASIIITEEMLADESSVLRIGMYGVANSITTGTIKPMLYQDGDGTWESFSEGYASPSTSYPQPIESVGDDGEINVGVYGGNLLPYPYRSTGVTGNGGTITVQEDGGLVCSGIPTDYVGFIIYKTQLMFADKFTVCLLGYANGVVLDVVIYDENDEGLLYSKSIAVNKSVFIDVANYNRNCWIYITIKRADNNVAMSGIAYPMIVAGDVVPTVYEKYKDVQNLQISTPNGLPAIKVTDASQATYTDENSIMWCADEIDYGRGKYVQRINTITFDGLNVPMTGTDSFKLNGYNYAYRHIGDKKLGVGLSLMSNIGVSNNIELKESVGSSNTNSSMSVSFSDERTGITADDDKATRISKINAVLQKIPVTVTYIIDTPIETDLSTSEIEAYKALTSNYPTTTILNDENAHMEAVLVTDTKNHIEQNYVPKSEFLSVVDRVSALEQKALA